MTSLGRCALAIVVCLAAQGCRSTPFTSARPASDGAAITTSEVVVSPTHEVDDQQAGDYEALDEQLHRPVWQSSEYQAVAAEELRRVAAANSWLANQLVWERNLLWACPESESACEAETLREVLRFREDYERNRAADEALESFYSLAETQAALASIERSLESIQSVERRVEELVQAELTVPIDRTELERQRTELIDRQTDLKLAQVQLNVKLRSHVGNSGEAPIWASDDWNFTSGRLDLAAHMELASSNRADLNGLYWLSHHANPAGVAALEKALAWTDPALGLNLSSISLCSLLAAGGEPDCCRFTNRREQVRQLATDYAKVVDEQVQLAALNVEGKQRQVVLAANRLRSWDERYRQLTEKQKINQASFFDVQAAEAKRIEARGQFVVAVIRWRAAQAKLQAAEGRLATHPLRSW